MIRGTTLALAAALVGGLLLSGVAQAASPLTLKCVRTKSANLRTCVTQCRNTFKSERAGCYGPGAGCAQDCSVASDACLAPITAETEERNDACNNAQRDAIDVCRSGQQEGNLTEEQAEMCANNARLAALECKLAAVDAVDEKRLACTQQQASCLGACASCGLPSQCP